MSLTDGRHKNALLAAPTGTYKDQRMMNLLKLGSRKLGDGFKDSGTLVCTLLTGESVPLPNGGRLSEQQIRDNYELEIGRADRKTTARFVPKGVTAPGSSTTAARGPGTFAGRANPQAAKAGAPPTRGPNGLSRAAFLAAAFLAAARRRSGTA